MWKGYGPAFIRKVKYGMGKQEFMDGLRRALNGNVSPALVMDNLNYYNEYINSEVRKGRSEEEVLASLGDPRLIARTIIEMNTAEGGETSAYQTGEYSQDYGEYRQAQYGNGQSYTYDRQGTFDGGNGRHYRIPGWVWLVALVVVALLAISFIFSVLSFLAPILIPVIVVVFLIKLFRDWLN